MNAISLFSGAMGLDLGIEKAGFVVRVCNEIEPAMVETIRTNSNTPVIPRDINDVSTDELLETANLSKDEVDLVFGGPPCQAFSTAGKRKSISDERGNVILSFLRVVRDIRPKVFLLENVRGLLYAKMDYIPKGFSHKEYDHVLGKKGGVVYFLTKEFEKLGYKISFALFDSANYGVPQKRERVLFFGTLSKKEITLPLPTHSETGTGGLKKWVSIKDAFKGLEKVTHEHVNFSDKHLRYLSQLAEGQYWKHLPETEQEKALGGAYKLQGGKTGFYRRLAWNRPSPTLVTSPVMPATMLCHPKDLRPLSVQEYAKIQQFPDGWIFSGKTIKKYKQIGNAVPVGLGNAAGKAIMEHLVDGSTIQNEKGFKYSRYKETDYLSFIPKLEQNYA